MIKKEYLNLYKGQGQTLRNRDQNLPDYEPFIPFDDPENYIASQELSKAVNVALALGQPLVITGEPGTGKTRLASSIAWECGLNYLEFYTKSTSTATDLFYHYDALRRFQDVQLRQQRPFEEYITCQALGLAILLANPTEEAQRLLPSRLKNKDPMRSVVLIDEIDKAPRDLPNDVLNEIEKMSFAVKEAQWEPFEADQKYRPVLVITSNSEKDLPDAFLRRYVFFHISFPDSQTLKDIVKRRYSRDPEFRPLLESSFLDNVEKHFDSIRKLNLKKKPAQAELLAWISILKALGIDPGDLKPGDREKVEMSYSVLAKNRDDFDMMKLHLREMK